MKKQNKISSPLILLFLLLIFAFTGCEKKEGEGGTCTILGRVLVRDYNEYFTVLKSEYYGEDIDVYIIYGKDSIYSDNFETGIGGWYRFNYLNKGNYKVYAISKDSTRQSPSGTIPIIKEVFINENHSDYLVDDIIIYD